MALTRAKLYGEEPEIEQPESSDESTDSELSTDEKLSILFQAGVDNSLAVVELAKICRAMVMDTMALKERVSALEDKLAKATE